MGSLEQKAMHFPHRLLENRIVRKIRVVRKSILRVVTLTRFVNQDDLFKLIQNVYILKPI